MFTAAILIIFGIILGLIGFFFYLFGAIDTVIDVGLGISGLFVICFAILLLSLPESEYQKSMPTNRIIEMEIPQDALMNADIIRGKKKVHLENL